MAAVVFDLDNTLLDTSRGRAQVFLDALRRWNPTLTLTFLQDHWTASFEEVVRTCAPAVEYSTFLQEYEQQLKAWPPLALPCSSQLLQALTRRGIKCFVFTATARRLAEVDLETTGMARFVAAIFAADEMECPKPDPRSARELVENLKSHGVPSSDCILVGDSVSDALIAQSADMEFRAVTTGRTTASDFAKSGLSEGCIHSSLCDLAGYLLGERLSP